MLIADVTKLTPKEYAKQLVDETEITGIEVYPVYEQVQLRDEILQRICGWEVTIKGIKKI